MPIPAGQFLLASDTLDEGDARSVLLGHGVLRHDIVVLRYQGRLLAYENACPHAGTPLETPDDVFFTPDGTLLSCATHGARFCPDTGLCTAGPCKGQHLRVVAIIERDGSLFTA